MLVHNKQIVHRYLMWSMCGDRPPEGKFDLYAVEGGTAAMCYIFKSLKANCIIVPGDTIALGSPIFTSYLEMPELEDYALQTVHLHSTQETRWQFTDEELAKLEDPQIKAFFLVNPGNPSSVPVSTGGISKLV
jgi:aspartate 4-decarboxylase